MLLRFLSSKANNVAVSAFRAQILKFRFPGAVRSRFPNPAPCFIQIPHPENTLPDPVSLNPGGGVWFSSSLLWDRVDKSECLGIELGIIFQKTDQLVKDFRLD